MRFIWLFGFLKLKPKYNMRPTIGAKKIIAAQKIFMGTAISCRLLSVTMAIIKITSHTKIVIKTIFSKTDNKKINIKQMGKISGYPKLIKSSRQ